jgi:hypothetical protein
VKPAILVGAVALAIGATAWHNNGMSISDIIGSKPLTLQCQYAEVTTSYGKSYGGSPMTKQRTMVVEINGGTWRLVSTEGQSWKEFVKQMAEKDGKKFDETKLNIPLRVTDETYVLVEPSEDHDGIYDTKNNGLYIDRISGTMTGNDSVAEKIGDYRAYTTTTGKCSPIDINTKL